MPAHKCKRDLEKHYSVAEFAARLRRLAHAGRFYGPAAKSAIIDAEIVACREDGVPRFQGFAQRRAARP
jgi:hypothetical protein